ncbi:hypothetical protein E2P81_ATG03665 [Venturia nashicola]|nr:hypothetical protein E2P81_ATG03665 [Venturia nashicola]
MNSEPIGARHWATQFYEATVWAATLRRVHPLVAEDTSWLAPQWRSKLRILFDRLVVKIHTTTEPFEQLVAAWKLEDSLEITILPGVLALMHRGRIRVRRARLLRELVVNWNKLADDIEELADVQEFLGDKLDLSASKQGEQNWECEAESRAFCDLRAYSCGVLYQEIEATDMLFDKVSKQLVEELGMDPVR